MTERFVRKQANTPFKTYVKKAKVFQIAANKMSVCLQRLLCQNEVGKRRMQVEA